MGCYGIGIGRTMAAVVEVCKDTKGIIWPESIAPAQVCLIRLGEDEAVIQAADALYKSFNENEISVVYDDRDLRAGEKFADADLMGIPHRVVVSTKTLGQNAVEYKHRTNDNAEIIEQNDIITRLKHNR